ncbi:hypothetical protein GF377_01555, partial [candidate division GN15 bacterium]|nr:hypothetical protein [candidate division GN15 bacterium]
MTTPRTSRAKRARKRTTGKKKKSPISAQDLYRLRLATGISISPDEKLAAYTVERMDEKARKYFTNIYMLDIASGESRQFTHGDHADGCPVWSHDGSTIAFVSKRDTKTGIY